MTVSVERQASWGAGELSPTLYGRTDLPYYRHGARRLSNFLVTTHGVLKNRPGTQFVERLTASIHLSPKLVPYVFSETDAAVLTISKSRVRPWAASELDPRFAFEFQRTGSTSSISGWPWATQGGIDQVRTVQLGKVITFVGHGFRPQEITRTDTDWTRSVIDFEAVTVNHNSITQPSLVIRDNHATALQIVGDSTHPLREWEWVITYVLRDANGFAFETRGKKITKVDTTTVGAGTLVNIGSGIYTGFWNVSADAPIKVVAPAAYTPGVGTIGGLQILAVRVYRGRRGLYGYLGEIAPEYDNGAIVTAYSTFLDEGAEPDLSNPPPRGVNPFLGTDNWPRCATYHEGRRFFASTENAQQTVWGSGVQRFSDFDEVVFADDADSLKFALTTSRKNEIIRAMVPRGRLYLLTSSGIRVAAGSGDQEVITPNSIAARSVAEVGCAKNDVIETPNAAWFVQQAGAYPMAMVFDGPNLTQVMDPAMAARHLFEGYEIEDWAWAENPWKILWVVRSDGTLLSCTFVPEMNVLAWATHSVADGEVVAVETIPEGAEDGVYIQVRVEDGAYYELHRLAKRLFTDIRHAVFLDRSVTYHGLNTANEDLQAVAFTVEEVGGNGWGPGETVSVVFDDAGATGYEGRVVQWDAEGGPPYRILLGAESPAGTYEAQVLARDVTEDGDDEGIPEEFQSTDIEEWYLCTQSVSGLSHLEGLEVTAVADGNVFPNLTVEGGGVDLGEQFAVVHVGRPYESVFESLDCATGDGNRDRQKVLKKGFVELEHRRGGKVGGDVDGRLAPLDDTIGSEFSLEPTEHTRESVVIADRYDNHGRIVVVQDQPMPMTILGVSREVEYGGR